MRQRCRSRADDLRRQSPRAQAAQKRVNHLKQQLASARALGYNDKHPDVERLQEEIKQARADLSASKVQQPANREER